MTNTPPHSSDAEPLVSVVIATYNASAFIRETLDSILANQVAFPSMEVIVVDDASKDDTVAVLRTYGERIRVLAKPTNAGPCPARNDGIRMARGQFIALCDHDDLWDAEKLALQVPLFNDPEVAIACTRSNAFDEAGVSTSLDQGHRMPPDGRVFRDLLFSNFITCSSAVVRRSVLDKLGAFDEKIFPAEDIDLWLRIASKWKVGRVEKVLTHHRRSSTQFSHNKIRMKTARMPVIEKHGRLLENRSDFQRVMANAWFAFGLDHWYARERRAARDKFRRAWACQPASPKYAAWTLMTLIPPQLRESIAALRRRLRSPAR